VYSSLFIRVGYYFISHRTGCVFINEHNVHGQDYLPDTLLRFLVTLVGTNFRADIDFSNSSMSISLDDFVSGIAVAGGFD
jgi:hypothetical protein